MAVNSYVTQTDGCSNLQERHPNVFKILLITMTYDHSSI